MNPSSIWWTNAPGPRNKRSLITDEGKKAVCHNCQLLRYFRNSTSVICISKLLSVSSSVPCILLILTHLKGAASKQSFWHSPFYVYNEIDYFLIASSTATATATVAPTIGLLPIPKKPIISTCAGTEEEPAN